MNYRKQIPGQSHTNSKPDLAWTCEYGPRATISNSTDIVRLGTF